ncbi:hypothetical protein ACHLPL_15520 (plasmid) [Enterococcus faecalis]
MSGFLLGKLIYTLSRKRTRGEKRTPNTLMVYVNEQNKVETFTRFFLTNYYSGKTDAKTRQAVLKKVCKKNLI